MILTTLGGLAIVAPAPVYTPGLLVLSAVALWRLRSGPQPIGTATHRAPAGVADIARSSVTRL